MAAEPQIVVRKRKFQTAMSDTAIRDSREELEELKGHRNISPSTKAFFETMIETFEELEQLDKHDEKYEKKEIAIIRLESILCARLAKDAKYKDELQQFRKLVADNILLRYGDYYKGNLYDLRKQARELGNNREDAKVHAQKSWKVISGELEQEKAARERWHQDLEKGIEPPPLETPTTRLVEELAALANMTPMDATFQIREYAKRCDIAHSSIDEAIARNALMTIAEYITRDKIALENGVLPPEMEEMKGRMLAALRIFERKFFNFIITLEDPDTGIMKVEDFEKSDEYVERRKMEEEALRKKEAQEAKLQVCEGIYESARHSESIDPEVVAARDSLQEAHEDRERLKKLLKEMQAEFSSADMNFKQQALKYQKIANTK